jgi:hypothetical protein
MAHFVTGTWSDAAGQVTGTIVKKKAAADETATLTIPIVIPSNAGAYKGCYLKTIDIYFEVLTAALDAMAATISKATLPADGAAIATLDDVTFSYDTGHDSAAERIDVDQHKMTLTLTTPAWIDDGDVYQVALAINAAATSVFDYIGARANYTLRL